MAATFCTKCGQPLPGGAQFCMSCGTPVAAGASVPSANPTPLDFGAASGPGASPPAPPGPPLAQLLGVEGGRNFHLQHLLVGPRHSYRVLDAQKRHLFTVNENVGAERAELWNKFVHPGSSGGGLQMNWGGGGQNWSEFWTVNDATQTVQGTVTLQLTRGSAVATVADTSGAPLLVVDVKRGLASVTATAVAPDGRPMFEARGNLFHHNFSIHDSTGVEVAKIHEAWASVRDTYNLDLVGNVDPIAAMIFAIVIDHYKGK